MNMTKPLAFCSMSKRTLPHWLAGSSPYEHLKRESFEAVPQKRAEPAANQVGTDSQQDASGPARIGNREERYITKFGTSQFCWPSMSVV